MEDERPYGASLTQATGRNGDEAAADIMIGADHAAAFVTLNRPQALNALTTAMRAAMARVFPRWARDPEIYAVVVSSTSERAFCAGGDVREITEWGRSRKADAVKSLAEEYALSWQLECLLQAHRLAHRRRGDGLGRGHLALRHASVAGERYRFAMPETGIGLFPTTG